MQAVAILATEMLFMQCFALGSLFIYCICCYHSFYWYLLMGVSISDVDGLGKVRQVSGQGPMLGQSFLAEFRNPTSVVLYQR